MKVTLEVLDKLVVQSSSKVDDAWLNALYEQYKEYVCMRINYYRFLYRLVQFRRPSIALELGVEHGLASAHMCAAAESYGGCVVGVDIRGHCVIEELVDKYDGYRFVHGDTVKSAGAVSMLVQKHGPIGVVFQDSSHHYAHSCDEWAVYSRLLDTDAVWVCDDITPAFQRKGIDEKSMVGYFQELPGEKVLYPDVLHKGSSVGVVLL